MPEVVFFAYHTRDECVYVTSQDVAATTLGSFTAFNIYFLFPVALDVSFFVRELLIVFARKFVICKGRSGLSFSCSQLHVRSYIVIVEKFCQKDRTRFSRDLVN